MKLSLFILTFHALNLNAAVDKGPEFCISESITEQSHRIGTICYMPNGYFAVLFTTAVGYDYNRKLFSAQIAPDMATVTPRLLHENNYDEGAFFEISLDQADDMNLVSYFRGDFSFSPALGHRWLSFNNEFIGDPFYFFRATSPSASHLETIILRDKKIVTLWRKARVGGNTYYEILQADGQSWKLKIVPCHYSTYSTQLCLLSSGNFLLNWFYVYSDIYGRNVPYTEYFEVQNSDGMVIHADSTQEFGYLYGGLVGLKKGGFITCYWQEEKQKAYVQAFSEDLKPTSEPQQIVGIDDPYAIRGQVRARELENGDIVVYWKLRQDDQYDYRINITSLDHGVIHSNMRLNASLVNDDAMPKFARLSDNRFILCWSGKLSGREKRSIFAKVYNADGTIHTKEFMVNDDDPASYKQKVVIVGHNNTALFSWESEAQKPVGQTVNGRFIFLDGTKIMTTHNPNHFTVHSNYPNPFNAQTTIQFDIPSPGSIDIHIYNASGRVVYLNKSFFSSPGQHSINWNGCDISQQPLPSGIYVVKLTFCDKTNKHYSSVQKIVLSR